MDHATKNSLTNMATRIELTYAWHELDGMLVYPARFEGQRKDGKPWRLRFVRAAKVQRTLSPMALRALNYHRPVSPEVTTNEVIEAKTLVRNTIRAMASDADA